MVHEQNINPVPAAETR